MPDVSMIILAAGNSSRMGQPKQLKVYNGKTMLEHAVDAGLGSSCSHVMVVLGSRYEQMSVLLQQRKVELVQNKFWAEGMGGSISTAISKLEQTQPYLDAVLIATCDQPFMTSKIVDSLIKGFEQSNKSIVAATYAGINGVPALFARELMPELRELTGLEGARKIIKRHPENLATVDFPDGDCDIDSESDWQNFLKRVQAPLA